MAHLIDKSVLVAEIERRKQVAFGWMETAPNDAIEAQFELCDDILSFLNTLEVKEVDLEKEIDNYIYTNNGRQRLALELDWKQCNITFKSGKLIDFAKHFFELGLKAQKGGL